MAPDLKRRPASAADLGAGRGIARLAARYGPGADAEERHHILHLYRDRIDLEGAISKIASVARSDGHDPNRRLALAALRSIGSYRATRHLSQLDEIEESDSAVS